MTADAGRRDFTAESAENAEKSGNGCLRALRALRGDSLARRLKSFGAILIVGGLTLTWIGCSIEKHYHLLSRFFDGVPDPALVKAGSDAVSLARLTGGTYYSHEPYAKEQCESCHTMTANMQLSTVDSTSCLKCHEGMKNEHARMHGPVVAGACLFCHAPHEATVKPLLRVSSQELCTQCHGTSLSRRPPGKEIPEHSDPNRSCLDCHSGHGGESRAYLRPAQTVSPRRATEGQEEEVTK